MTLFVCVVWYFTALGQPADCDPNEFGWAARELWFADAATCQRARGEAIRYFRHRRGARAAWAECGS